MSKEIHNEVVKMEFDNAKFERGVKQSMSTLDKLRNALNFDKQTESLRQLEKEANKVTFDDMAASLSKIEKRFSAFGIVGMTVMQDLTRSAENFAKQFASTIAMPIKQAQNGGWSRAMNIKDAEFAMKGLGIVGERLKDIKDDINFAVSGTAYGYDAAAKAAAQFAASNIEIGNQMKMALRSVSGVAAQTNSTYEDISGIFTTVAANGRLMTEQLRQLSYRGLNATATLGKALGKSEAEINDMVTKGKISFDMFAKAMDDAFGEHATAANETFTGALNNMKAALSRIGANFADPLIDAERDIFNKTRDILNSFNSVTNITKSGEAIRDKIVKALDSTDDINVDRIRELNRQLAKQTSYITELGKSYIKERDALKALENPTDKQTKRIKELNQLIKDQTVIGSGAFERLANVFQANLHNFRNTAIGMLQDPRIMKAGNNIIDTITEFGAAFSRVTKPISRAWRQIFPKRETDAILQATKRFKKFFKELKLSREAASDLESGFRGVFSVLSILSKVAGDFFNVLSKVAVPVSRVLLKVFGWLGERLVDLEYAFDLVRAAVAFTWNYFDGFKTQLESVGNVLKSFSKVFSPLKKVFGEVAKTAGTVLLYALLGIIDALKKLTSYIPTGLNLIQPFIEGFVSLLSAIGNGLIVLLTGIQNGAITLGSVLGGPLLKAVNALGSIFKGAGDGIRSFTEGFRNTKVELTSSGKAIDETKEKTGDLKERISGLLDVVKEFLSGMKETDGFQSFTNGLSGVVGVIVRFVRAITPAKMLAIAFIGVVGLVTTAMLGMMHAFTNFIVGTTGVMTSIKKLIDTFTGRLAPIKKASTQFREYAEGILIISGSLALLSRIPREDLEKSLITLGLIMVALAAFVSAVSVATKIAALADAKSFNTVINSMLKMSVALGVLSLAVALLSKANIDMSIETFGKVGLLLLTFAALMGIMTVVGNYAKGEARTNIFAVIALAGSLYVMVKAFEKLNGLSIGGMWKTFAALIPVIATVGILALAMSKIRFTNALGFFLAVSTLYLAIPLLKKFMNIDFSPIFKTLDDYKVVIAIIGGLGIAMAVLGRGIAGSFASFGKALLSISAALMVLVGIINILGNMDQGVLTKGLMSLGMLMVMVAALELFSKLTQGSNMTGFGVGLLAVSGSLIIMTGIVAVLGMLDARTIKKGLTGIIALTACVVAIEIASKFTANLNPNSWKTVLATVIEIAVVTGALLVLAGVPWQNLMSAMVGLSGTMAALTLCMAKLASVAEDTNDIKLASFLVALEAIGMIWVMGEALSKVAQQPWQSVAAAGAAMSVALLAVGHTIKSMGSIEGGIDKTVILETLAIIGMIWVMGEALSKVAQQPWQSVAAAGASIIGAIAVMGLVVKALSNVNVAQASMAALDLLVFIGILAGAFTAIDWITQQISGGEHGIEMFGEAIGKFISGIGSGLTSQLPQMGKDLGEFADNSKSFFDTIGKIKPESIKMIPAVSEALLALAGAEMIDTANGVLGFITGQNDSFTSGLEDFGNALKQFQDATAGIKPEAIKNAATAGKALAEMASAIPNSGGKLGEWLGENDIDTFGDKLPALADGLQKFCERTKDLQEDGARKAKIAMDMINAFSAEVPNSGGLAGLLAGENYIDVFGVQLPVLADGLQKFCNHTKGLETDGVEKAKTAMDMIIAFSKQVPNSGGLFGMLAGNNDIDTFGNKLEPLAEGLVAFSNKLSSEGSLNLTMIEDACKSLLKLAITAKTVSGSDAKSLSDFTADLYMAAGSYKRAIGRLPKSDLSKSDVVSAFIKNIKQLAKLNNSISAGIGSNLGALATDLQKLSKVGLNTVSSETINTFTKAMDDALKSIESKEKDFVKKAHEIVDKFNSGISEKQSDIVTTFNMVLDALTANILQKDTAFYNNGKHLGTQFANGIGSAEAVNAAKASATRLGNAAIKALDVAIADPAGVSDKAFNLGKAFSNGFTVGIQNNATFAARASKALGDLSAKALDKAIDDPISIFGPISNVSKGYGESWGKGYGAGMAQKSIQDGVEKASAALAQFGLKGLNTKGLSEAAGKVFGGDFVNGITEVLKNVKRKDKSLVDKFFNEIIPKDFLKDFGIKTGEDLANTINNGLSTGGSGSGKGGKSGGSGKGGKGKGKKDKDKWGQKDINEVMKYYKSIFKEYKHNFDAFNSELLENGKITIQYLANSIKDEMLANSMGYMGADVFKKLNKEVDKEYELLLKKNKQFKKNGDVSEETKTKLRNKAAKNVAEKAIKEYTQEFKDYKKMLSGMTDKKAMNAILKVPSAVAAYVKNYKKSFKKVKGVITSLSKQIGGNAQSAVESLGKKLYMESDEYKEAKKEVKSYGKQLDKIYSKAKKYTKIAMSDKASTKQKQNAKARLKELAQQEKQVEKSLKKVSKQIAKGPAKAIEQFRDSVKETVKDFLSLSNINFSKVINGFDRVERSTNLKDDVADSYDIFSVSLSSVEEAAQEAADAMGILNVSVDTGINLLERFSKVSTVSVRRLMKNATSQIKAYQEFQNGIQELRNRGLNSEFVDELQSQGVSSMNYLRGFLKMTAEEITQYNSMIAQKTQYEVKATEDAMKKQVDRYEKWSNQLTSLTGKIPDQMLKQLKENGVDGADFVDALIHMDDASLARVASMYTTSASKAVASGVTESTQSGYKSFLEGVRALAQSYDKWNSDLAELATRGLSDAVINRMRELGLDQTKDYVESMLKETSYGLQEINNYFAKTQNNGQSAAEVWLGNIKTTNKTYKQWINDMKEIAGDLGKNNVLYKALQEMGWEAGAEYANAFVNASESEKEEILQAFNKQQEYNEDAIMASLNQRINSIKQWNNDLKALAGRDGMTDAFMKELIEMGPEAYEQVRALTEMSSEEFKRFASEYSNAITTVPETISNDVTASYARVAADAINSFSDNVESEESAEKVNKSVDKLNEKVKKNSKKKSKKTGKETGEVGIKALKEYVNEKTWKKISELGMTGLVMGVLSGKQSVLKIVSELAQAMNKKLKKGLDAHSPSREWMRIGEDTGEGLVIGLAAYQERVADIVGDIGDTAVETMSKASKTMNDAFNGNIHDISPTITPVLDTSALYNEVLKVNALLGSFGDINVNLNREANKDVVSAINNMEERFDADIAELSRTMSQLQVVMDSGTLVGELAGPIDTALYQRTAFKQRGM